jgi:uncharacterized SAM-binding protein YcdF (DUF218 family)
VTFDVIVLLGCRNGSAAARRRSAAAAAAWHARIAPLVLISGGRRWAEIAEAEAFGRELQQLGVPQSAIVPELCSLTTRENARYCARILRARGARRTAIVTCDWHLPRALACFRASGIDALGLPAASPPQPWLASLRRGAIERIGGWLDRAALLGASDLS